jgi:hypothetical protein
MSKILVLDQLSKSSTTNPQPRKRLGAQKTLAFATATAAFFAMAGTAQAQDCVNGYRMVKDEIPVACSIGHFGRALDTRPAGAQALYTGSVNTGEQLRDPSDPSQCIGGYRHLTTTANGWTLPLRCDN